MPSGHHGLVLLNCNYNFFSHVVHFTFILSRLSKNEYQKWVSSRKFLLSTQYFTNVYTFDSRNEKLSSKVNYVPLHYWHDDIGSNVYSRFGKNAEVILFWILSPVLFIIHFFTYLHHCTFEIRKNVLQNVRTKYIDKFAVIHFKTT